MTVYSLVLFAHITSVITMFACLSLEALSLLHLRCASTVAEIQRWIDAVPGLSRVALGSMLVILLSGIYLTVQMSGFGMAWIDVALGTLFLLIPLAAVTGRRMREIRRLSTSGHEIQPRLLDLLQHAFLKISLVTRIAIFVGIVLLMTAKPGLPESLSIIGVSVALGLAAALFTPNKKLTFSTTNTGARG
jgi:uncharacterized membrane protein